MVLVRTYLSPSRHSYVGVLQAPTPAQTASAAALATFRFICIISLRQRLQTSSMRRPGRGIHDRRTETVFSARLAQQDYFDIERILEWHQFGTYDRFLRTTNSCWRTQRDAEKSSLPQSMRNALASLKEPLGLHPSEHRQTAFRLGYRLTRSQVDKNDVKERTTFLVTFSRSWVLSGATQDSPNRIAWREPAVPQRQRDRRTGSVRMHDHARAT